ncbi:hypothetical protein PWT90_00576 [Aphanocladium album]|nr:hypothetical protein PWT90_00576 [Aphanocladium album]
MIRTGALGFFIRTALAFKAPTWPDETNDALESILYEQFGNYSTSFALNIDGCQKNTNFPGQNEAAEWIRAGFHDMATADMVAGTGGLDASIAFELDRAENPGRVEFTNTLAISRTVLTSKSSVSDGVALSVLIASQICSDGQVDFPYRYGRIDARQAGPSGVPEPQDDIDSMTAAFQRTGFSKTEMIGLVACGHSIGGVNGVDFPTIVTVPENETVTYNTIIKFEQCSANTWAFRASSTLTILTQQTQSLTIACNAKEFVNNTPKNPLAFGHNVTMRSDARIFNSDGKKEISRLAASSSDFYNTCSVLMEKMVNTVPRVVKLTDPIMPIPVKPMSLFATVNDNGTMTFKGTVRLIYQKAPNPNRSVKILLGSRGGSVCAQASTADRAKTCRTVHAVEDPNSATYTTMKRPSRHFPEFKRYDFTTVIPISEGLGGFNVEVTDKQQTGSKSVVYTNNGHGFRFTDTFLPQLELSCIDGITTGLLNLTIAVEDVIIFKLEREWRSWARGTRLRELVRLSLQAVCTKAQLGAEPRRTRNIHIREAITSKKSVSSLHASMEVALTFGSLGDIIQLSQLAIQLGRAVGVAGAGSGESAREYQDLRQDLDLFVRILMQASKTVVATYQQHEVTPYLQELDAVSKTVVDNCTTLIQDALNHLQARYGSSLTKEGSGNKAVDVMKRVEWCMKEKTRLGALRAAIQQNTQRLLLLSNLSASKSARVDSATLLARIDQVQQLCQTNHQQVLQRLAEQHEKSIEPPAESLGLIKRQLDAIETTSRTSMSMIGDVLQGVLQIKNLVFSLSKTVVNLQIMASHTHCMRGLDPTKELPVILEDALGRPLEIPAQWLDTLEWNALNVLLVGYFRGKKGRDMVQRRQYTLEDGSSGKDINFDVPPSQSLRRGMKIYMSMAFIKRNIRVGACPRCYAVTDATEGLNIQWYVTTYVLLTDAWTENFL